MRLARPACVCIEPLKVVRRCQNVIIARLVAILRRGSAFPRSPPPTIRTFGTTLSASASHITSPLTLYVITLTTYPQVNASERNIPSIICYTPANERRTNGSSVTRRRRRRRWRRRRARARARARDARVNFPVFIKPVGASLRASRDARRRPDASPIVGSEDASRRRGRRRRVERRRRARARRARERRTAVGRTPRMDPRMRNGSSETPGAGDAGDARRRTRRRARAVHRGRRRRPKRRRVVNRQQ